MPGYLQLEQDLKFAISLSLSRSILTYPWMELGGKCVVKCEKTGYRSEIEFHCKVSVTYTCTPL